MSRAPADSSTAATETDESTSPDDGDSPEGHKAPRGPLAGIRVLDLGTVYAAPITAMLLGDWGADVIKVEHPRGDPARTHGRSKDGYGLWWKVIARNKRTITLNFSKPDGQDILRRLVEQADVVIENFRPGVMEKWGLGPEELQKINPNLVMLRVTVFGQEGLYHRDVSSGGGQDIDLSLLEPVVGVLGLELHDSIQQVHDAMWRPVYPRVELEPH